MLAKTGKTTGPEDVAFLNRLIGALEENMRLLEDDDRQNGNNDRRPS